ncbi:uncharacterized protein LOC136081123 [Hydra vulgaris]|uniref:Uncharacterized protein LOC136081123 n=1 Tax=Hydra vulgaris TaxID=6087 RepID=A0ABM4BZ11_HYDVU
MDLKTECFEDDCGNLVKVLMNEFSAKGLKLDNNVNFSKWKLSDLRYFLKLSKNYHGFSNLNKEKVLEKVIYVWNNIVSSCNLSSNIDFAGNSNFPTPKVPIIPSLKKTPKFEEWTILKLQEYLSDHGINRSGNKQTLVNHALGVFNMNLPITFTDATDELNEIQQDVLEKLFIEKVQIPHPMNLKNGWTEAPANFPEILLQQINDYLYSNNAGKAFKGGISLFNSGHLSNVMSHAINDTCRYCFIRGLCLPEQKLTNTPYDVWVVIHKDSGDVVTGDCSCPAGTSGICKHVGALLWYIEKEVSLDNNFSCTSKKQQWSVPSKKQSRLHVPATLVEIELKKAKKEENVSNIFKRQKIADNSLTESDIDSLADITNDNCGLVTLMRKKRMHFNICVVQKEIEIAASFLIDFPKMIAEVIKTVSHALLIY